MTYKQLKASDVQLVDVVQVVAYNIDLSTLAIKTYDTDSVDLMDADGQNVVTLTIYGNIAGEDAKKEQLAKLLNIKDHTLIPTYALVFFTSRRLTRSMIGSTATLTASGSGPACTVVISAPVATEDQTVCTLIDPAAPGSTIGFVQLEAGAWVITPNKLIPALTSGVIDTTLAGAPDGRYQLIATALATSLSAGAWIFSGMDLQSLPAVTCRIEADEYTFSSNPTYISKALINEPGTISNLRTYDIKTSKHKTYITRIGFYDANRRLLAIAKMRPVSNDASSALIFSVPLKLR